MWATKKGFTIVELLIVIVVIAILAAITVVAYNGVQQNAKNAQIGQVLTQWVKAINVYKADKGVYPSASSGAASTACLGQGYPYGFTGTDLSGGQCRYTTYGVTENSSFVTALRPYIGNGTLPTPTFAVSGTSGGSWYRGLTYIFGGGGTGTEVYINATFVGITTCPVVAGVSAAGQTQNFGSSGNTYCIYQLGLTTDT